MAATYSLALLPSAFRGGPEASRLKLLNYRSKPTNFILAVSPLSKSRRQLKTFTVLASVSVSNPEVRTGPDDLVASILSKVKSYIFIIIIVGYESCVCLLRKCGESKRN